jgi:ABC-type glycerol-3-phosphate transport system permease component
MAANTPSQGPGFVVALIWQFTSAWNDFLFAVVLTGIRNGPSQGHSITIMVVIANWLFEGAL